MKKDLISLNRKEDICRGLRELMKRKSIQKITIQELADECGISRYTFYYHFTDIYDCLSWMLQEEIRTNVHLDSGEHNWEKSFRAFFQNVRENRAIYKHLLDSPRPDLMRHVFYQEISSLSRLIISDALREQNYRATEGYMAFLTDFFTSAIEGMMVLWCRFDEDCTEEKMTAYLHTILDGRLTTILERAEEQGFCVRTAEPVAHPEKWNDLL